MPPAPERPKESRRWIVLLISVLIAVVIASCGLCAWAGSGLFGSIYNQASDLVVGSQTLVDNYYGALQSQQYNQAYAYLHPEGSINGLSQAEFIQRAQQADKQYGPVLRYSSSQPAYTTNGTQITNVSITVSVARQHKQYTVQLKMQKFNNQWKIIDYNQL
jgi:flagellar basal body-associated protein FliL